MNKEDLESKIFFKKYQAVGKIGEGSFGQIYRAKNIINPEQLFAIKLESKLNGQNLLEEESYMLSYLKGVGIPYVKSFGYSSDYNVLVMELLGPSLDELLKRHKRFSLKTVCMLGIQMLNRIEFVHEKSVVHRDIKPDNFTLGIDNNSNVLYLIDFGLAKKYRSHKTLEHITLKNNKKLTGTARYASINALKGYEQSRRDDLESIGYVLVYLLKGSLPWQGLKVDKDEDRYKKIYQKKLGTPPEELCAGLPEEFVKYVHYSRKLAFEENPNYEYLRGLIYTIMSNNSFEFDNVYDWSLNKKNCGESVSTNTDTNHVNITINLDPNVNNSVTRDGPGLNKPYNSNYKFIESVNDKCNTLIRDKLRKSHQDTNHQTIGNKKHYESFITNKSYTNISTKNDQPPPKTDRNCLVI